MKYELLVVIPAKYSESELPGIFEGVLEAVRGMGAEITTREDLGKQKLAYPIGDARFGHILLVRLEADQQIAKKINEELRLKHEVIRHMITKASTRKAPAPRRAPQVQENRPEPAFAAVPESSAPAAGIVPTEEKVTLEDLDRKLDEILGKEII